jgi:hypothetical protein
LNRVGTFHGREGHALFLEKQVALADDAEHPVLLIDHRQALDAMLAQQFRNLVHRRVGVNADHILCHDFLGFHGRILLTFSPRWQTSANLISRRLHFFEPPDHFFQM